MYGFCIVSEDRKKSERDNPEGKPERFFPRALARVIIFFANVVTGTKSVFFR